MAALASWAGTGYPAAMDGYAVAGRHRVGHWRGSSECSEKEDDV